MNIVFFTHSIRSDWNNGHAHFLRGVVRALKAYGHNVRVLEPEDAWSVRQAHDQADGQPLEVFREDFPDIRPSLYDAQDPQIARLVKGADMVVVQEWNDERLVRDLAACRREAGGARFYFHDAHHRLVTDPRRQQDLDLEAYDAVLAFGQSLAERYRDLDVARRVFTWHEAADTTTFRPRRVSRRGDLVWVGNWGDEERSREIEEFVVGPAERSGARATMHGVRYPPAAQERLHRAGIDQGGWIANSRVPLAFGAHAATVHVPRGPYRDTLPGIPTIRVFEALACGIPLISAPWEDREGLFTAGQDLLMAADGHEAEAHLRHLLDRPEEARRLARQGLKTVLARHTCGHRAAELLRIDRLVRDQTAQYPEAS